MKIISRLFVLGFSFSMCAFGQTAHLDSLIDAVSVNLGKIKTFSADAEIHKYVCS